MNEKGFFTLLGISFLLPMLFLISGLLLIFTNEQKMSSLTLEGTYAQYLAENALEKTLADLCSDLSVYDQICEEARYQNISYKKTLYTETADLNGRPTKVTVSLRFFNYSASYFTLSSVGEYGNTAKRITVYIKETNHILSIVRWDYHEQPNI
ncbi:hypothetical protein [Pectinatus frisingensis]|uniref:hypothetical protein n=1 Tax=Pectinatus frisingensis TaxID=865 RepID=UPI0018C73420|nr:hypothetical protein [Pectinatus frisingensis]